VSWRATIKLKLTSGKVMTAEAQGLVESDVTGQTVSDFRFYWPGRPGRVVPPMMYDQLAAVDTYLDALAAGDKL
jgi:hypothetical protein